MNIVIVSPEAVPYAKTGGLADVAGALYSGMQKAGHSVNMFLPCYKTIKEHYTLLEVRKGMKVSMGDRTYYYDVYSHDNSYFISNEYFFNREGFYGNSRGDFLDNAERFAFFCLAVIRSIQSLNLSPDIIHMNDWQTGLISLYHRELGALSKNVKTVFTIHNAGYQGLFPPDVLPRIGVPAEYFSMEGLEFYGNISLLKAGIMYSDTVTTVSPNYQKEITSSALGYGLSDLLKAKKTTGILNGIDTNLWNPKKDKALKKSYSSDNMSGKIACKSYLIKLLGLSNRNAPLIGVIGRFSTQKGYDIISESLNDIIKLGANVAILGKGDMKTENFMRNVATNHSKSISLTIGFDDQLARRIYAGSDMFIMPSRYEPCGVAQMIAMRYGSVPIVRLTGGLADTVKDYNTAHLDGNGFVFAHADRYGLLECIKRALCVFQNEKDWLTIVNNAMQTEFTWKEAINRYVDLYSSLVPKR